MKIFIVDDNQRIRKLIKKHLEQLSVPVEVFEYENGESAVSNFQKSQPDLILMDIMMKGMDGLTAIKEIRKISTDVKIIAVSQLPEEEYKTETISIGANDYLNKENLSKLPDMINEFLKTNNKNM